MKNEKKDYEYCQSFPRFCDTYRFNEVKQCPEKDGQLDIVEFVQNNYVDSFSKLLNRTIDELIDNETQDYVTLRNLDDLIEMSQTIDRYKEDNNIPLETSFEEIIQNLQKQQINKEEVKENEKKEIKQEI